MAGTKTKGAAARKPSSLERRADEALSFAREAAQGCRTWVELHNAVFGIGGKFAELFPTQSDRAQFSGTPQYAEITRLISEKPGPGEAPAADKPAANGRVLVRLPQSIHAALLAEADAEGVSLNQLCVAKLSVQLQAQTR